MEQGYFVVARRDDLKTLIDQMPWVVQASYHPLNNDRVAFTVGTEAGKLYFFATDDELGALTDYIISNSDNPDACSLEVRRPSREAFPPGLRKGYESFFKMIRESTESES